ncbi:MAG: PKD domain-containing protein [Methanoregula sp.]|jgi:PKD repeat protein
MAPSAPVAGFSATPTSGTIPLTVQFTEKSTGTPLSLEWDFGDGGTSTERNPSYTYTIPGTYTVILTTKYSEYSIPSTKTGYITTDAGPASSQAALPPFTAIGAIGIFVLISAVASGRKKH